MSSSQLQEVVHIWKCNEELWSTKIEPQILVPLEKAGGVKTPGPWENVVATAFGRALQTFQSIQLLCKPDNPLRLWADAFILTRILFETFVTLEWIDLDQESRLALFEDVYALKLAHFYEQLGELKEQVDKEKQKQIIQNRDEVVKRRECKSTAELLPSVRQRAIEVATKLPKKYPHLASQYEFYYRDVSSFAHPSAWGMVCSLSDLGGSLQSVEPSPQTGFKAVFCNGGWFFNVLKIWNEVFGAVPGNTVEQWFKEWTYKAVGGEPSGGEAPPASPAE